MNADEILEDAPEEDEFHMFVPGIRRDFEYEIANKKAKVTIKSLTDIEVWFNQVTSVEHEYTCYFKHPDDFMHWCGNNGMFHDWPPDIDHGSRHEEMHEIWHHLLQQMTV